MARPYSANQARALAESSLKHNAPVEHPSTWDIAWAAGIYEGEGSCSSKNENRKYGSMTIQVVQKDRWILDRLRAMFGGSVQVQNKGANHLCHVWCLHGPRARGFSMTIYKFLSPRRRDKIQEVLSKWLQN